MSYHPLIPRTHLVECTMYYFYLCTAIKQVQILSNLQLQCKNAGVSSPVRTITGWPAVLLQARPMTLIRWYKEAGGLLATDEWGGGGYWSPLSSFSVPELRPYTHLTQTTLLNNICGFFMFLAVLFTMPWIPVYFLWISSPIHWNSLHTYPTQSTKYYIAQIYCSKFEIYQHTLCPRRLDPFCLVTYTINGSRLLGYTVLFAVRRH